MLKIENIYVNLFFKVQEFALNQGHFPPESLMQHRDTKETAF